MEDWQVAQLAGLVQGAARRLSHQHRLLARRQASALDLHLSCDAGTATLTNGAVRPWLELVARAYWACGGRSDTPAERRRLEIVLAAFASVMVALEILDDLVDGDSPSAGLQAPNMALALLGESTGLLCRLPSEDATRLLAYWSTLWTRCAAAQALDVTVSAQPDPSPEQVLAVAKGSGLVTRWAMEVGALLAGAECDLRMPLTEVGQHFGTAEKLLHDLHDLWPGVHSVHTLSRPHCSLALAVAQREGIVAMAHKTFTADDAIRRRLLESGVLHYVWAWVDAYRLRAAAALDRFVRAGGDPAPLVPVLAIPPELLVRQVEDAQL